MAEMTGQLGPQRRLDHPARELADQPARAGDPLQLDALERLVERVTRKQLVEALTHRLGQIARRPQRLTLAHAPVLHRRTALDRVGHQVSSLAPHGAGRSTRTTHRGSDRTRHNRHKERNVCDLLPERDRDQVRARMRAAWALSDADLAEQRLELLATELDRTWPDAAASLREGMVDTLTLMRLGITGNLAQTLSSTNPCESMIEIVRYTQRNVKRWQDGDMRKRWTAAGMLVAEQQFRRIIGYRDLATLVIAIERHAAQRAHSITHTTRSTAAPEVAATAV